MRVPFGRVLVCVTLALAVAACGGDDGGSSTPAADTANEQDVSSELDSSASDGASVDAGATDAIGDTTAPVTDVSLDVGEFGGVTKPTTIIEIDGLWRIGSSAEVHLTSTRFGKVEVVHYDNDTNRAYTTAPVGVSGPGGVVRQGVYSVYQWTEPKGGLAYLCQVDTNLNTEKAALQSTKSGKTDQLDTGCNGGPWIKLERPELSGVWASSFGGNEVVTALEMGSINIIEWDNESNTLYTQNPDGIGPSSLLFNRVVWTEFAAGPAWYCKLDVGMKSLADAKASTKTADDNDPDNSGCNGFGWTKLSPLAVRGTYAVTGGALGHITSHWWNKRLLAGFDNAGRVAWLRNHPEAETFPNRYARVVWTEVESGGHFWACVTDDGLSDLSDAQESEKSPDATDPGASGCNGGPWTRFTKVQ